MKTKYTSLFTTLLLLLLHANIGFAATSILPLTTDGAWSMNSQPSVVYHNGKTYITWISAAKSLVIASYDHATKVITEKEIASGYASDDNSSPSILIRKSGQILVFASKNQKETNFQCYRSTSTTGDITQGFSSQNLTGYGISSTIPYAMGNDIIVLWRSKNNLGYSFIKDANAAGETGALATPTVRTGFLGDPGFGNNYGQRSEVPLMRTCQDENGDIHIVITQLGTGLKYSNSTIHYVKAKNNASAGLKFYKADGTDAAISYTTPPDIVYAAAETNKAWAYDIAVVDGKPIILFDAFTGNDVNASENPGQTSNHIYKYAKWDGSDWTTSTIENAGDGLPVTTYTAVQGYTFHANSYMAGGITFDAHNPSIVYLSKKSTGDTFEIYKYQTNDNGNTWSEIETITSGTDAGVVNIRPICVQNAPADYDLDVVWMRGIYTNPTSYSTGIYTKAEVGESGFVFENSEYTFAVNDVEKLKIKYFFMDESPVTLSSSDPDVVQIQNNGNIKCLSVGTATITATLVTDPTKTAVCKVSVVDKTVFHIFVERIILDILSDKMTSIGATDAKVDEYLLNLQANGSFPDIDYSATDRTDWPPMAHLDRMLQMALAYTQEGSSYYEDTQLKAKIEKALEYWQNKKPSSNNWYQNQIGEPQRMGMFLILMQYLGTDKIETSLFDTSINRMNSNGGDPSAQTGANRVDVALHWMYRACLTRDAGLLQTAMDWIYSPIVYTTGSEGIQYDNSYTQHGRQLHIGSYGEVFTTGITKAASYAVGTEYSMPTEKINILSGLIRDTYCSAIRGEYIFFNAVGRAVTRPDNTKKTGSTALFDRMIRLDPDNADDYSSAIARITGTENAGFGLSPKSTQYFKSDYAIHQRPEYSVELRTVSTRTARNEYLKDNGEGLKQYFMSDGATGIYVDGDEYYNIFPVWDWTKIPGVTAPNFPTVPQASSYIKMGESNVVGGVTDSVYAVSAYQQIDNYTSLVTAFSPAIQSSANKAWFFFDKEVVCLGNSIQSTADYQINTTVNQTLLKGNVVISANGSETTLANGSYHFDNNLDWAWQGKVAYYFPKKGKIDLSAQSQNGSWLDINTSYTQQGTVTEDVFSLSFNHGVKPDDGEYAYIIVPNTKSQAEAAAYNPDNIEIILNSDSLQAVYHKELGIFGVVFHRSCGFKNNGLLLEADAPCAVLVKNIDLENVTVYVADLKKSTASINIGIETPLIAERKLVRYSVTETAYLGTSLGFVVNNSSPKYEGRDVNLDRSDWTITTSFAGASDGTVGGNQPEYIIDGDEVTSFLFVKPGKIYDGLNPPSNYQPSFTIDMKSPQAFSYFIYRHRTESNTQAILRASAVSFWGKNDESGEFELIVPSTPISTSASEVKIEFPEVSFRYVKLEITDWDNSSGNTVQVSEFNMGKKLLSDINEIGTDICSPIFSTTGSLAVFPNPVKKGNILNVDADFSGSDVKFQLFDVTGKKCYETGKPEIDTAGLNEGMYLLQMLVGKSGEKYTGKIIISPNR